MSKKPSPTRDILAFRLLLEYEGTRYAGWQRQGESQNVKTIAGCLEQAVRKAGLELIQLYGAGRTDAGVHALGQVAHLKLRPFGFSPGLLLFKLNDGLPSDIVIRAIKPCSPTFHARHDALERSYLYHLSLRRSALFKPFLWWIKRPLDLEILNRSWKLFQREADFSSFSDLAEEASGLTGNPGLARTPRGVHEGDAEGGKRPGGPPRSAWVRIFSCEFEQEGGLVLLRVRGDHFLPRQVRRMVGAAVQAALGDVHPDEILRDLEQPSQVARRRWATTTAPASGLFLESVRYPNEAPSLARSPFTLINPDPGGSECKSSTSSL